MLPIMRQWAGELGLGRRYLAHFQYFPPNCHLVGNTRLPLDHAIVTYWEAVRIVSVAITGIDRVAR